MDPINVDITAPLDRIPNTAVVSVEAELLILPADELALRLVEIGISHAMAQSLARSYPERVLPQIEYLEARNPRNRAATLVRAIQQNWSLPAAPRTTASSSFISPRPAPVSPLAPQAPHPHAAHEATPALQDCKGPECRSQDWKSKAQAKRAAVENEEAQGTQLDAVFDAFSPDDQAEVDRCCRERLALLPPLLARSPTALVMMRRKLLSQQEQL